MDLPLYITVPRSALSDLGSATYQRFDHAIILDQIIRQRGEDPAQVLFRDILLRLRDGRVTEDDWKHLMKQTPAQVEDLTFFSTALRLHTTVETVVNCNVTMLHSSKQAIATIKAVHTGPGATKVSSDDASGLEPVICMAHGARVMFIANLWVDVGLVNGAMGTVVAICYRTGQAPPNLPIAVTVHFDSYTGPTLAAPHQPLCTCLHIDHIRVHAHPHNALHSPTYLCKN